MICCADDYGMAGDINRTILELCHRKRLSAVSCMTALERCSARELAPLLKYQSEIDIGLHLCFADKALQAGDFEQGSELRRTAFPSFNGFLWECLTRSISVGKLVNLIAEQYQLFTTKAGRPPDYIDGHLHAHQLPGVRAALTNFVQRIPPATRPYVRNTSMSLKALRRRKLPWAKAFFIGNFGTTMKEELEKIGIETNSGFAGIYDFRKPECYPGYLAGFVDCLGKPNDLVVVHPGESDAWRGAEFNALVEFDFPAGSPNRFRR